MQLNERVHDTLWRIIEIFGEPVGASQRHAIDRVLTAAFDELLAAQRERDARLPEGTRMLTLSADELASLRQTAERIVSAYLSQSTKHDPRPADLVNSIFVALVIAAIRAPSPPQPNSQIAPRSAE